MKKNTLKNIDLFENFLDYIAYNELIKENSRVLMAVSGGIDSMVMSDMFIRAGIEIGIAHCNFKLRGQDSDKDEELVKNYAQKHKIPFFSIRFDTKKFAHKEGISTQMAARDLRYNWFEEIRTANKFDLIAVAHNLNDNIETILINLTRGTGISGLAGIKPKINHIVRPLLFATREEIKEYCQLKKIIFREDCTNAETKYTRNKIRHKVLPVLKEINPSVEITLNELSGKITDIEQILGIHINEISKKLIRETNGEIKIDVKDIGDYSGNKTIVYEIFKPYGITGPLIEDLLQIINGKTGKQLITSSHRFIKNRKEIIINPIEKSVFNPIIINGIDDLRKVPFIRSVKKIQFNTQLSIPADKNSASLDFDKTRFPLLIRKWEKGDTFYPFGMNNKKKLSDYFIDRKYSIRDKQNALVLEGNGQIIWLIGERIDNRFRITESTKKVLKIKLLSSFRVNH